MPSSVSCAVERPVGSHLARRSEVCRVRLVVGTSRLLGSSAVRRCWLVCVCEVWTFASLVSDPPDQTRLSISGDLLEYAMCLRSAIINSSNLQEITLASRHDSLYTACELAETAFATRIIFPQRLSSVSPHEKLAFNALTPATQAKIMFDSEPEASRYVVWL